MTSGNGDSSGGTNIQVGRQTVNDGAVGVQFQVGGRLVAPRSTLLDLGPLFGRGDDLAAIADALKDTDSGARIILSGEPGVGKTHLANAYGANNRARYPGGMFFIAFNADPGLGLAKLISPPSEETIADRAWRMLASIEEPTLLIYDNVPSEDHLMAWIPPAGLRVHVLVTTTSGDWTRRHTVRNIRSLDAKDAHAIVEGVAGQDIAREYGVALVRRAGGIAVRLRAVCDYVDYEVRHGRKPALGRKLDDDTESSFAQAFSMLTPDGQLAVRVAALFNQAHIPRAELDRLLASQGWNEERRQAALDAGVDRRLLTETSGLFRMHQLVAEFVRAHLAQTLPQAVLEQHLKAFVDAAQAFVATPASTELRARIAAYPHLVAEWETIGVPTNRDSCLNIGRALGEAGRFGAAREWAERVVTAAEEGDMHGRVDNVQLAISSHLVGYCLASLGHFAEARPHFEHAVAAAEKGDMHGRVNNALLTGCLHQVGLCLTKTGHPAKAMPWFERSVEVAQNGDEHGRVDHASLGTSLHQVGYCLSVLGQRANARLWFERAVMAAEKGDLQGRLNHESLSKSLWEVGQCSVDLGHFTEARPWFERAVMASEKGDLHGRVDHDSLGKSLHQAGYCLSRLGQFAEAMPYFERAVVAREAGDLYGGADHEGLGSSLHEVGYCLASLGQPAAAMPYFERAVTAKEVGGIHGRVRRESLVTSLLSLGNCFAELGEPRKAQRCLLRVAALPKTD